MSGELENAEKRRPGGKEKEWTDCVVDDLRLYLASRGTGAPPHLTLRVWVHGCDPGRVSDGPRLALYMPNSLHRAPFIYLFLACVCVCVFFPFVLDIKFVGRTSRDHKGGRSHRISHPPSFCGASLYFSREKDSAIPFPRQP